MNDVPENVKLFVSKCSDVVASFERQKFQQARMDDAVERQSPIEQLFEIALVTVIKIVEQECDDFQINGEWRYIGIKIYPQCEIEKYKADFALFKESHDAVDNTHDYKRVVVELDGHAFHDKDEKQRRYEKKRDRDMQKLGYKVFRYTGSEIVKDPFASAIECVSYLTNSEDEELRALLDTYMQHRGL